MAKPRRPDLRSRRGFLRTAAAAAATGTALSAAAADEPPTTGPTTRPSTGPATKPTRRPTTAPSLPPLGNAEPPAVQFQAYPGGTAAYLLKVVRQRGATAFDRVVITPVGDPVPLPGTEQEIAFLPVHQLAGLIRAGKLSAVELTRIYLGRLHALDPVLLCAVTILDGPAIAAAEQADRDIKAGRYRGPLHGIPWGVKDLFAARGTPTTWGAAEFKDRVIDADAEVVTRLTDAGAILVAKLATGRYALGDQWYRGRTNNPWNPAAGSSGSSAGPASATAAGCVAFAIGTETRGSIVSPATVCGLSALRPTFGRVSRAGGMTLAWTMDRVGPLCRTVEDCAIVFSVLHGVDEADPSTLTAPFDFDRSPDLANVRIGYDKSAPRDVLDVLRKLGADPKPMPARPAVPPWMDALSPESAAAFDGLLAAGQVTDTAPNGGPGTGRFTEGRPVPAIDYLNVQRHRELLVRRMAAVMADFDLYVCSANLGDVVLTSLTGHPAVVVPAGFGRRRGQPPQPLCTTLVGNLFADDTLLSVAHAYQQATHWHERHPKVQP